MPTLTITKNYSTGAVLTKAHLDDAFDSVSTFLNSTKIDSTNIQSGGIVAANLASDSVTTAKISASNVTAAKLASDVTVQLVPTGGIIQFGGSSAPSGFLLCDGTAVSRTTYAALFAITSTTYGVGDGSTTFNLPNFNGRAAIGAGNYTDSVSGSTTRTLGATHGAEKHALTTGELASHSHVSNNVGNANGGAYGTASFSGGLGNFTATNLDTGSNTSSTGSGTAHNNMQPSLVVNFIIKT